MARRYPYDTSASALLSPAKGAAFFENWEADVDTANHDLLCAEMSRLAYAEGSVVESVLPRIGFTPIGFVDRNSRGTEGFAAKSVAHRLTVLAFRGTEAERYENLISDVETLQKDYRRGERVCRVHAGFLKAYEIEPVRTLIAAIRQPGAGSLLVTGHSLGAALATLAAVDLAPARLITFGSPRVGDDEFRALFAERDVHRYVDCCDVVGRIPPERFDAAHFSRLLGELGVPVLSASILSSTLGLLNLKARFVHVSAARYIRFDGTITDAFSDEQQAADQKVARAAYPHSPKKSLAEIEALLKSLLTSPGSSLSRSSLQQVPRKFVRELFNFARNGPVPLRDLADHAPINYVSGITGR